ncbi:MAG: hypothetical protein ACLR1T_14575 [Evtepia gabavorous]
MSVTGMAWETSTGPPSPRQSSSRRWRPFWPWTGQGGGNAEVGIYGPVSMEDLDSAWCVFPFSLDRIQRQVQAGQRARRPQPVLVRPGEAPCQPGDGLGRRLYLARPKLPGGGHVCPGKAGGGGQVGTRVCRPTSPMCRTGAWSQGAGRHTGFNFPR